MASETRICTLISSPIVTGFLVFPPEPELCGLPPSDPRFELDLSPNAFFIFDAAVDVNDLCNDEDELFELLPLLNEELPSPQLKLLLLLKLLEV